LFERRSQVAPLPARQDEPRRSAANSSNSLQDPRWTMIMWRSEPPSIFGLAGIGYGPRSDSLAYWKRTRERLASRGTTLTGIPIGLPSQRPEPKSACSPVSRPMLRTIASERGWTGRSSTR
jgi:hypothetical protein